MLCKNIIPLVFTLITYILCQDEKLIRPCPDKNCPKNYLACIRRYFAAHSNCCPDVPGVCDKLVAIDPMELEIPCLNHTQSRTNETWSGLQKACVKDFYINPVSNKAVVTVEFPDLQIEADDTLMYHGPGEEDKTITTHPVEQYKSVITTTVIPNKKYLDYENSRTYGSISQMPEYTIGGEMEQKAKTDCDTIAKIDQIRKLGNIGLLEGFLTRSPILFHIYLNNAICRFDTSD